MKIYKTSKTLKDNMDDWYTQRTKKHISMVGEYCRIIANKFEEFSELIGRIDVHDKSKFEKPEKDPYVYITWKYKCKNDGLNFEDCDPPDDIEEKMYEATMHHILNNRHHPEFHLSKNDKNGNILNRENRDAPPDKPLDVSRMPRLDIAEMVADWCAISKERGNSPKSWADKNIGVRWNFSREQKDLIYEIIEKIWE